MSGEANDAVSACTSVKKMSDASRLVKLPETEHAPSSPKHWDSIDDPMVKLERNLHGHPWAGLLWERRMEEVLLQEGWEKVHSWECLYVHRQSSTLLISVCRRQKNGWTKTSLAPTWLTSEENIDCQEPTHSLIKFMYDARNLKQ